MKREFKREYRLIPDRPKDTNHGMVKPAGSELPKHTQGKLKDKTVDYQNSWKYEGYDCG